MANKTITILCVHGLGDHRTSDWHVKWQAAITGAFPQVSGLSLDFRFVTYDDIFAKTEITALETLAALWKLTKSGVTSLGPRDRGIISDISEKIKWTAGYVVAWVEDETFKKKSRKRMLDAVREHKPDVILAHSLGSLITYNAFGHADAQEAEVSALLAKASYVTAGSQIANPFVIRNLTNGRILPLAVRFWHHLYNVHDNVFTAPIRLWEMPNFRQTDTPFDEPGIADHTAQNYFGHVATTENVWTPISQRELGARPFGPAASAKGRAIRPQHKTQRALLVGINEYPDPANRLEGCVNDVFTMSSVLQDCGVPAHDIRVCLDDRATKDGILTRIKWLLDEPKPGDELFFFYSGHGAQVPEYGDKYEPDHYVETLVPWDFDWSREKMIDDAQIYDLYSQLPYGCRLVMVFDCCHSGGIHRDGTQRPKGIAPPDDIRHRELKWDSKAQMWVSRDFTRINEKFTPRKKLAEQYFGPRGATVRLGRASMLRGATAAEYERMKRNNDPAAKGPYLPVIIEACGEEELSYEYRHGATSYGAFTYSLASILRRRAGKPITFQKLVEAARDQLAELKYDQVPRILGPTTILESDVPWVGG